MTLPKTLIQYGAREVMGADARATHDEITGAGGVSVIQAWPDQGHVFQLIPRLSAEARSAIDIAARFVEVTAPVPSDSQTHPFSTNPAQSERGDFVERGWVCG